MFRLFPSGRGDRSALRASPLSWALIAINAGQSMTTSYLPVVLATAFAFSWVTADLLVVTSKFGIVVSLLTWSTLGSRISRRNLAALFLLINGVTLLLAAMTDSPLGVAGYLVLSMVTAPSWILLVRLIQDQALKVRSRSGAGDSRGRATVIAWTVTYVVLIGQLELYSKLSDNLPLVLALHGTLCLIGAACLRFVLPGEAPDRTTVKLTRSAWTAQFRLFRESETRTRYWLWGLSGAMLTMTEVYLQRHLELDLGQTLDQAARIFTASAAVGVVAALWMDKLTDRYPQLCLIVGGVLSITTFATTIVGILVPSRALEIVLCYVAATLSEIASTALGTVFSIQLTRRGDGLDDTRLGMGNTMRFTFQGLAGAAGGIVGAVLAYAGQQWFGLALALTFMAIVLRARSLRYKDKGETVVGGAIMGLTAHCDAYGNLTVNVQTIDGTTTPVEVGHGLFTAAGGAIRMRVTAPSWWRRAGATLGLGSLPAADAAVEGPAAVIIGGRTLRFRLAAGNVVSVRLARGVVWRLDRSEAGVVRLFWPLPTSRRAPLTDAWVSAPVEPDHKLPRPNWSALLTMDWSRSAHAKGAASRWLLWPELVAACAGLLLALTAHGMTVRATGALVLTLALGWLSRRHVAHARRRRLGGGRLPALGWGIAITAVASIAATMAVLQLCDAQPAAGIPFGIVALAIAGAAGHAGTVRVRQVLRAPVARG